MEDVPGAIVVLVTGTTLGERRGLTTPHLNTNMSRWARVHLLFVQSGCWMTSVSGFAKMPALPLTRSWSQFILGVSELICSESVCLTSYNLRFLFWRTSWHVFTASVHYDFTADMVQGENSSGSYQRHGGWDQNDRQQCTRENWSKLIIFFILCPWGEPAVRWMRELNVSTAPLTSAREGGT